MRGFEGARAPPERGSAPSHCQKHPLKMKEKLMKHSFKPISIKVMVVLTFILGLYLLVFSAKLYDASFGNAKGGSHPPPPTPAKVGKYGLRARVKADFTAMMLRQYEVDQFKFCICDTTLHCLSNDCTPKYLRLKLPEVITNIQVDTFL